MSFVLGMLFCVALILLFAKGHQGIVTHKFDWIWERRDRP